MEKPKLIFRKENVGFIMEALGFITSIQGYVLDKNGAFVTDVEGNRFKPEHLMAAKNGKFYTTELQLFNMVDEEKKLEEKKEELLKECYDIIMKLKPSNPGLGHLAYRLKQYKHLPSYRERFELLEKQLKKRDEEYIICAANWYKELPLKMPDVLKPRGFSPYNVDKGIVFCGWRHHNCLYQMVAITGLRQCEAGEEVQGFLTNTNRFVTREEAGQIAFEAGQTKKLITRLHSEDLY
jgi:hypothetical protein